MFLFLALAFMRDFPRHSSQHNNYNLTRAKSWDSGEQSRIKFSCPGGIIACASSAALACLALLLKNHSRCV